MNQNTKSKILSKSLELFNTQGVESITTRHIAKELGMSQGNLHYHYPNKNEIILVLFSKFLGEIKEAERTSTGLQNPKEVLLAMHDNFNIMYGYRFLFTQNEVVWRRLPTIKTEITSLFERKKQEIIQLIELYRQQGRFRKDIAADQIQFLAEQFIFTITSWLTAKEYTAESRETEDYSAFLFRIWLPYLNQTEMKKWEELLN